MALSVFMHGSRNFQVLNKSVTKLLATQFKSSHLALTPIIAKQYSGLNQTNLSKKIVANNNIQLTQTRTMTHSTIWTAEKLLSLALLGVIPICLTIGGPICDNIFAVATTLHMHWGVEAVVVDYIRPSVFGHTIPVIAKILVYVISIFTLSGLLYFNLHDMGISKAVRRIWAITPTPPPATA